MTTFSITTLNITMICDYSYAECCILFIIMLSVIMLNVVALSVVMLSVVMLSVIMLSVLAPFLAMDIVACLPPDAQICMFMEIDRGAR